MESSKMRDRVYTLHSLQNSITRNRNLRHAIFQSPCRGRRNTSNNRVYSDTRAMRARDSISGRQGSLTPACGTAWPRRLYYDVYGLIRDILEMSRVHARRALHAAWKGCGAKRGPGIVDGGGRGTEGAKIDVPSHAESESPPLCASPPSPFIIPLPPSFLCSPFPPRLQRQHGSIVRGSINWVSTARPLVPLVLRRYERSSCLLDEQVDTDLLVDKQRSTCRNYINMWYIIKLMANPDGTIFFCPSLDILIV